MPASPQYALVVEDDPSWQQILNEILSDFGLIVELTDNQVDAVTLLKNHTHRLAVVDLSLSPDDHSNCDGLHVLEATRRLDPNCQTILLTGFATVELAVSVLTEFNAFTFLRKERFNRSQFRETVYRLLANPPTVNESTAHVEEEVVLHTDVANTDLEGSRGNVLLVEDDAGWRSILCELLADAGFRTLSCSSFGEALGYLRREVISLAVIDLSLTGSFPSVWGSSENQLNMEGYQLLAKTHHNHIPTLVVSGVASSEEIQKAYAEQSIYAYLEKQTFDREIFRRTVEEAFLSYNSNDPVEMLTNREREVLGLLAQGLSNKEIADKLVVTNNTVKRHLKAIFEKLGVHTRSAAVSKVKNRLPGILNHRE